MKMTLSDLEFIRLLPQFMRNDLAVKGLSLGLDIVISHLSRNFKRLTTWDQIDNLTETELDELAWELNILWYEQNADISVKRDLIKNSDKVYQHLGTKWAVENVITSYFGNGRIEEWFEYDGQPGRFRIFTTNPSITSTAKLQSFLNLLYKVKRASAHLDAIWVVLEYDGFISYGACSEFSGKMDVWPLVPRKIDSCGYVTHSACSEFSADMKVIPLAARSVDTSGEAGISGGLSFTTTLEIYPIGGEANG